VEVTEKQHTAGAGGKEGDCKIFRIVLTPSRVWHGSSSKSVRHKKSAVSKRKQSLADCLTGLFFNPKIETIPSSETSIDTITELHFVAI
jgi:hypothetical protein